MSPRILRFPPLIPLALVLACGGLAASNVGDPTMQQRLAFNAGLAMLHVGMPMDSLNLIFAQAKQPGEAGILRQVRIVTADTEQLRITLGWRSDPRHQIGLKALEEIEVVKAVVVAEDQRIRRITRSDVAH